MRYDIANICLIFWKYVRQKINLGKSLRYFGDGFQIAKKIGDKRVLEDSCYGW